MINYEFCDVMPAPNSSQSWPNLVRLGRECGGDGVTIGKKA
jgi:hypothetical protein